MKTLIIKSIGFTLNTISFVSKKYAATHALELFTKPLKGKINERQSKFLDTAHKEELLHNGIPIMTYRWSGNKKTILLAHGWESNSARWEDLIIELNRTGYNIVVLDAPAHGNSGGRRFNAILYSEFIATVSKRFNPDIVIGHSVGGMASVFSLKEYPNQNAKKLILLGAPSEFKNILNQYVDLMGYNNNIRTALNNIIIKRFGKAPDDFSTAKYIQSLETEILIVHDKLDKIIPYQDALLIKNNHQNSTLITTEGLGHSLRHQSIVEYIFDFIEN